MIKVAINGFGRIGRAFLRARFKYPEFNQIEITAINDLASPEMLAHLFKHDSVLGKLPYEVHVERDYIIVNEKRIRIFQERDPEKIPWREAGVDYVIESSGLFTDGELARKHLKAGAKRVIISAPAKNEDVTIVMGVNEDAYDPTKHFIVSNASCTTNCLAPILALLSRYFEIEKGFMTTVHAYTNDQRLLDMVHPKDFRRARAAALNMIPTSTGVMKALQKILPSLADKIEGLSVRVPTCDVSLLDLVIKIKGEATTAEVNKIFKENQSRYIAYCEEPLVSQDFIGDPHSAIIDGLSTKVIQGDLIKILAWYDNEWGYSVRLLDLTNHMISKEF
ncbi:MAG: type I glyceraldehyde-3-phosphate dehydrogenase [Caldimicrobium sp.]|nr:type I glyceraldehyde-3-phosphate dehydrogenase [Caldimicrobium sp.]MCX7613622.1 type I glyceraldehyde-3-phosphate dehydrogenase [Caldimicrobium sp.]MDW8183101.1 type I glyceraldehyde-3-phosphate dehydrogenase [Caldimicrobium sp.]